MITINGQKMGKSLGNFITLNQFFDGSHDFLERSYSPMTIRFFILQAHYRSTVDFSNEALQAAEKGFKRLMNALQLLEKLPVSKETTVDFKSLEKKSYEALNDDFNSPVAIAHLFDAAKMINAINDGKEKITQEDLDELKKYFSTFVKDILGFKSEEDNSGNDELLSSVISHLLEVRQEAKKNKDFNTADKIRDALTDSGIVIKDTKEGAEWSVKG
jgi:cysteinyl-tRNA synthetase